MKKRKTKIIGIAFLCFGIILALSIWTIAGQRGKIEVDYKNGNLSVNIEDAEIKDVLEEIGKVVGVEVEIIEGFEKQIESNKFENVPLRDALWKLVGGTGFGAVVEYKDDVPVKIVVGEKERDGNIASTPEEAVMLFTSALIEGDIEKALNYYYLGGIGDKETKIDNFRRIYGNSSKEYLIQYGKKIQSGTLGKIQENEWSGRAEWNVEQVFEGKIIIVPIVLTKTSKGWKIESF